MSALPKRFFTPEEYLDLEVKAEYKSQYVGGEIFAMSGVQPPHDRITCNIIAALSLRFRGRDDQPEERLALASIDCELPLAEIYDKVAFPTP